MSNHMLQVNTLVSPMEHSETGLKQVKSNAFVQENVATDNTISNRSTRTENIRNVSTTLQTQQRRTTSMPESPPTNRRMTWRDKLVTSKDSIQTIRSSRRLHPVLTSKEKRLQSYWTKASEDWSMKLWLPTETGSVGLHGNTSVGCLNTQESISSLQMNKNTVTNKNSQMTSCQSSMFSLAGTTVCDGKEEALKYQVTLQKKRQKQRNMTNSSRRKKNLPTQKPEKIELSDITEYIPSSKSVELLPTAKQKRMLNDWIASYRKVRNMCLESLYRGESEWKEEELRNKFVIEKHVSKTMHKKLKWTFRSPKRVREYAVKDILTSYKACTTQKKKGQIKHFRIHPTSKFKAVQTISIPHERTHIKMFTEKPHLCLSGMKILMKENLFPFQPSNNMRLTRRDGRYILHVPTFSSLQVTDNFPTERIVSVDPGVNIPFTWYSPDGEWGEVGLGLKKRLNRFYSREEQLRERLTDSEKLKKALNKLNRRKFNMVEDFQWKSIHWFLKQFKTVVIPTLYVRKCSKLLKKQQGDIRHSEFVKRLIYKSMFYEGRVIHHVKEHGTSALCTWCRSLLAVKTDIMRCDVCNLVIHRDLGAARSILSKHLN